MNRVPSHFILQVANKILRLKINLVIIVILENFQNIFFFFSVQCHRAPFQESKDPEICPFIRKLSAKTNQTQNISTTKKKHCSSQSQICAPLCWICHDSNSYFSIFSDFHRIASSTSCPRIHSNPWNRPRQNFFSDWYQHLFHQHLLAL